MKKKSSLVLCLILGSFILAGCSNRGEPFEEKSYTPDAQIKEVNLDVRDREIDVSLSEDKQIHINYYENDKEYFDISVSDENVLTMASKSDKEWTDYIGVKSSDEGRKISLQVPDALLENITLSTTNEDITLSALAVTGRISLSSNNGNIIFGDLEVGKALYLTVKNGDISGTVIGSYDDFAIQSEVKKGKSNLPDNKDGGAKTLNVSGNNSDADIEFVNETGKEKAGEPEIVDADWSELFHGLNGTAVVYDVSNRRYTMYNGEDAVTRRSPCSTFKIISSLIALENGVIIPEDSIRKWSGEMFWNKDWNKDIDFSEAFRTSCVWYYRQVIDDIGKDRMQKELDRLQYGNCDISDWKGRLNTNNNNRALTGFWIESSLMISPKEQAEVMERIFGDDSEYSEKTQKELKQVMLVPEQGQADPSIYGKTGMGKAGGIVADAWFTGFAENTEGKKYFCVHLGRTDGMNVSSSEAKKIAIRIVREKV